MYVTEALSYRRIRLIVAALHLPSPGLIQTCLCFYLSHSPSFCNLLNTTVSLSILAALPAFIIVDLLEPRPSQRLSTVELYILSTARNIFLL
jgi:hypothetical protein